MSPLPKTKSTQIINNRINQLIYYLKRFKFVKQTKTQKKHTKIYTSTTKRVLLGWFYEAKNLQKDPFQVAGTKIFFLTFAPPSFLRFRSPRFFQRRRLCPVRRLLKPWRSRDPCGRSGDFLKFYGMLLFQGCDRVCHFYFRKGFL